MNKKGSIKIIIVLAVVIICIVGYLFYKNKAISPQTIKNQQITIDVKESSEQVGTMTIPSGWETTFSSNEGKEMIGEPTKKTIVIKNGEYSINIKSFGSGRAVCGKSEDGKMDKIANDYISFTDNAGNKYFRQKLSTSENQNSLEICSNGQSGKNSDLFDSNLAAFGVIDYKIPSEPSESIIKQMDVIVASFVSEPVKTAKNDLVGIWQSSGSMGSGWNDRYHFYSNGNFHFYPNQTICSTTKEELLGSWKIGENSLTLSINSKIVVSFECDKNGPSAELSREAVLLEKPETEIIKYTYSGIINNDTYPSMKLDNAQFWKFSSDPTTYGDEQFPTE